MLNITDIGYIRDISTNISDIFILDDTYLLTRGELLGKPKVIKVRLDIDPLGELPYRFSRVHSEGYEFEIK